MSLASFNSMISAQHCNIFLTIFFVFAFDLRLLIFYGIDHNLGFIFAIRLNIQFVDVCADRPCLQFQLNCERADLFSCGYKNDSNTMKQKKKKTTEKNKTNIGVFSVLNVE